ncbi:MAG: hypothetical protein ABI462_05160 [Ignavibacteria bacterium]
MKKNKPVKKISVFYFLILLIITSVILVIYINNIIEVNSLSVGNNLLRDEINKNVQTNELLRAEAEKLSSFERIKSIVSEKYNLSYKDNSTEDTKIVLSKSQLK